jgi:hypothetical protein
MYWSLTIGTWAIFLQSQRFPVWYASGSVPVWECRDTGCSLGKPCEMTLKCSSFQEGCSYSLLSHARSSPYSSLLPREVDQQDRTEYPLNGYIAPTEIGLGRSSLIRDVNQSPISYGMKLGRYRIACLQRLAQETRSVRTTCASTDGFTCTPRHPTSYTLAPIPTPHSEALADQKAWR